tara:strand:- start:4827 stop:5606 length:780 start_codon:yes stop_codon:yes gene_type:complete
MRRLQQLLQSRIIFSEDVLYFTFKKNTFFGNITQGGLIWKCQWQKPGANPVPIFQDSSHVDGRPYVRTFESLTDWTETCIQECLDEYHTRYSSWKRVRHQRLDQPMEVLFKHFQRRNLPQAAESSIALHEHVAALQHHLDQSKDCVLKWKKWFTTTYPALPLPVMDDKPTNNIAATSVEAQPFVLNSDSGQYMVLHRVNEVAPPECVNWLKQNGPTSFKSMLTNMKQKVVFDPPTAGQDTWAPVDTSTAKRFVHQFFSK